MEPGTVEVEERSKKKIWYEPGSFELSGLSMSGLGPRVGVKGPSEGKGESGQRGQESRKGKEKANRGMRWIDWRK